MIETFVYWDMHTHHWRELVKSSLFIGKVNQDPAWISALNEVTLPPNFRSTMSVS